MSDPGTAVSDPPSAETTSSFEAFFEAERHRLNGALTLMTANAREAEEIVQDAFVIVWERWDRVRTMDRPDGYLYRVAMNAFRRRLRRLRLDVRLRPPREEARDPFVQAAARDETARALALLPRRERAALVLTELLDLDSKETAELLKISSSTVRVLANRAKARIRREIGDPDE